MLNSLSSMFFFSLIFRRRYATIMQFPRSCFLTSWPAKHLSMFFFRDSQILQHAVPYSRQQLCQLFRCLNLSFLERNVSEVYLHSTQCFFFPALLEGWTLNSQFFISQRLTRSGWGDDAGGQKSLSRVEWTLFCKNSASLGKLPLPSGLFAKKNDEKYREILYSHCFMTRSAEAPRFYSLRTWSKMFILFYFFSRFSIFSSDGNATNEE